MLIIASLLPRDSKQSEKALALDAEGRPQQFEHVRVHKTTWPQSFAF